MPIKPLTPAQTLAFDRWHYLNKDLVSPDSYITFGLYFMVSAALQRRVWFGSQDPMNVYRLFPNQYFILVGPPAVGKSLLMRQINSILRHHKQPTPAQVAHPGTEFNNQGQVVSFGGGSAAMRPTEAKLLIPVAPESVTAEELFRVMNDAILCAPYKDPAGASKKDVFKSLAFVVEELSMLFKAAKETKTLISFLLLAYDCGDFEHGTKTQGHDKIRKMCLNMFAGVQPSCLNDLSNTFLIGEGFASRVVFVFEVKPRKYKFGQIVFSPEQYAVKAELIKQVQTINQLYGEIKFNEKDTPEAWELMRHMFEEVVPLHPTNNHPTLANYYGRKQLHAIKLATAIHFSYSTELTLFPEDCQFALNILEDVEVRMHHALAFTKNPLAGTRRKIYEYLKKNGPTTKVDLLVYFSDDVRLSELDEILQVLLGMGKVTIRRDNSKELYMADTMDNPAVVQSLPEEPELPQSMMGA